MSTTRRAFYVLLGSLLCVWPKPATGAQASETKPANVVFISIAPSPYKQRHDCFRAGIGILLLLRKLSDAEALPLRSEFYDASTYYDDRERLHRIIRRGEVILVGGSTWSQGSSYLVRKFFETVGGEPLLGTAASAWATAGGMHTGGEVVIEDILRSLMGMGAQVFALGQKLPVFTTEEREEGAPGQFTLLDCWYMDQFARTIAVAALGRGDPRRAEQIAARLSYTPMYYNHIPARDERLKSRFGEVQVLLNEAANPKSEAYRRLREYIAAP